MGLFRPAWKSKNTDKALRAAQKLSEQSEIALAAKNAHSSQVRKAAIERLSDQKILREIAEHDPNFELCCAALNRIDDIQFIIHLAHTHHAYFARQAAIKRIDDIPTLLSVIRNERDADVREVAYAQIKDQDILLSLAQQAGGLEKLQICNCMDDAALRASCLKELAFPNKIDKLTKNKCNRILKGIIARTTDQAIIIDVAENAVNSDVCLNFIAAITDQDILFRIAQNDPTWYIRRAAMEMLTNEKQIAEIAKKDGANGNQALERLTDTELIKEVENDARYKEWKEQETRQIMHDTFYTD